MWDEKTMAKTRKDLHVTIPASSGTAASILSCLAGDSTTDGSDTTILDRIIAWEIRPASGVTLAAFTHSTSPAHADADMVQANAANVPFGEATGVRGLEDIDVIASADAAIECVLCLFLGDKKKP